MVNDLTASRLPRLPERAASSHKGTFGTTLVVGGCVGMSGSIALTAQAALRSGAGLVFVAVPEPILSIVAGFEPSYLTVPLPADPQGRIAGSAQRALHDEALQATAVAFGPGLGQTPELRALTLWLYRHCSQPLVIDADGLNNLSAVIDQLTSAGSESGSTGPSGPRVLTPHPGEFSRLTGRGTKEVLAHRQELATEFAARHGVVLVLKGHETLITDGERLAVNQTGNPGLATGGTGDVLTGMIASLLGQGMEPLDAARVAAHVHGRAADLAAAEVGMISLIASDLLRYLPAAFRELQ